MARRVTQGIEKAKRLSWQFWIIAFVILGALAGAAVFIVLNQPKEEAVATVEEITLEALPQGIADEVVEDREIAGFYEYDAGPNTYVLLSYGSVSDVAMNVTPRVDKTSVYFAISSTKVSNPEVAPVYRFYLTDATAISADETALRSPNYGVGSTGMNVGLVDATENGEFYVTPLKDTAPTDRVFKSNVTMDGNGLYYFEYSIQSAGAYMVAAEKLDEYEVWVKVDTLDKLTADLFIGDEDIRLQAGTTELDEDSVELLQQAMEGGYNIKVTLGTVSGTLSISAVKGVELIDENSTDEVPEVEEGGATDEENENA